MNQIERVAAIAMALALVSGAALISAPGQGQVRGSIDSVAKTVNLVAQMPGTARVTWRVSPAPKSWLLPEQGGSLVVIDTQGLSARGESLVADCRVEATDDAAAGLIPLGSYDARPPIETLQREEKMKVLSLIGAGSGDGGEQRSSKALLVFHSNSPTSDTLLQITVHAF